MGYRRGALVLIGGSEDRTGDLAVLRSVVELNGARRAVVIPSASSYGEELSADYQRAFSRIGLEAIDMVYPRTAEEAQAPAHAETVAKADLIFFTGGDQSRLVGILRESALLQAVLERLAAGATVAGTSAGAAAAGNPMIYDGNFHGYNKGSVRSEPGFGLLPGLVVDTHFVQRNRIARLSQFLASGGARQGIGIAEDTGLVVQPDLRCRVVGNGVVMTLTAEFLGYSNYESVERDSLITVEGFRMGVLGPGTLFDLPSWTVIPGPPSARQECG